MVASWTWGLGSCVSQFRQNKLDCGRALACSPHLPRAGGCLVGQGQPEGGWMVVGGGDEGGLEGGSSVVKAAGFLFQIKGLNHLTDFSTHASL